MNLIEQAKERIYGGEQITKDEALTLVEQPLEALCKAADEVRAHFCGNKFDLCTIINGKSGRCTEDCKYCAQSCYYHTDIEVYPLLDTDRIVQEGKYNGKKGILRYAVVTSGRRLNDAEIDLLCESYRRLRSESQISLCASHGLLTRAQFRKLKMAGVTRYHNNLETSRRYFPEVCTTHTYDEKIQTIKDAQAEGLEVCSGGIIGMGESWEDRIDLALEVRSLGIVSIPVNIHSAIPGTPFGALPRLSEEEIRRTVAVFRFLIPKGKIRLAGGRGPMQDKGKRLFCSGANAAISGDMLTTAGITIDEDFRLLESIGYEVKR